MLRIFFYVVVMVVIVVMVVMVMVMMIVVMVVSVVVIFSNIILDPKPRHRVPNYASQTAKFLQRIFESIFQVVRNDKQQLADRVPDQRYCSEENKNGDDDSSQRVPQVPRFPECKDCTEDYGERASCVGGHVQIDAVHVFVAVAVGVVVSVIVTVMGVAESEKSNHVD